MIGDIGIRGPPDLRSIRPCIKLVFDHYFQQIEMNMHLLSSLLFNFFSISFNVSYGGLLYITDQQNDNVKIFLFGGRENKEAPKLKFGEKKTRKM